MRNVTGQIYKRGLQFGSTQEGMTKETRGICFQPGSQTHSKPSAAVLEAMHVPSPQFITAHAAPVKPHS